METPAGLLALRVYVGEACKGTLYRDDGASYKFKKGKFLQMESACSVDHGAKLFCRIGVITRDGFRKSPSKRVDTGSLTDVRLFSRFSI